MSTRENIHLIARDPFMLRLNYKEDISDIKIDMPFV